MTQKRKRYDKQFEIAAARVVLGGKMRVVDLARELGIEDSTLRRWAQEHEEMGENTFLGNGSPKVNRITRSRSSAKGSRNSSATASSPVRNGCSPSCASWGCRRRGRVGSTNARRRSR